MDFKSLVENTRSVRRFKENESVSKQDLYDLVELARLAPSGRNLQPLKFLLSNEPSRNAAIFSTLRWAGYLDDWRGPAQGERPAAYIVVLMDKLLTDKTIDHGFAAQNIILGARDKGLGACILKSFEQDELAGKLSLPDNMEILLVIALGRPLEAVVIEPVKDNDIKYWRDENGVFHVPKRSLDELIIE
ncbi:MAG: nitroreductase family protein [Bacteroidales bacterium]|nr:nitroreductase family protein [Bacteroidales bacterium]